MRHLKNTDIKPFDFDGLPIRDYTGCLAESASVAIIDVPPGVRHKDTRSHRSDKFYVSLEGAVLFSASAEIVLLKPHDSLTVRELPWRPLN